MQKHYNYLTIDLDRKVYNTLKAKQGDAKSRYILVNLTSNNLAYDLTDTNVKVYGIKKDNTQFFNNATIIDAKKGQFEIELTSQALAVPGYLKMEILVLGANQERLSTSYFYINVEESIIDDAAIESTNEFKIWEQSLNKVEEWNNYFEETNGKLEQKYTERLNKIDEQFNTIESEKATLEYVDESITKAKLEGSSIDTSIFAKRSDLSPLIDRISTKKTLTASGNPYQVAVKSSYLKSNLTFKIEPTTLLTINKKKIIDGTESWWVNGSINQYGYYRYSLTLSNITSSINVIENMKPQGLTSSSSVNFQCYSLGTNGILSIYTTISTLEDFKNWLKDLNLNSKPLTLLYSTTPNVGDTYYIPLNFTNNNEFVNINIPVSTNDFTNKFLTVDEYGKVREFNNNVAYSSKQISIYLPTNDFNVSSLVNCNLSLTYSEAINIYKPYKIVSKNGLGDYTTIQSAIDNSENGTTIYVMRGKYEETVDFKSKVIHLIGENKLDTIIFNTIGEYSSAPLFCTSGSIKNLTIHAKRTESSNPVREGYAVHLDSKFPTNVDDRKFECDNCIIISDFNDCFGAGTYEGTYYYINNTLIIATNGGACFKCHQGSTQVYAEINLSNVIMKCNDESTTPLLFHDGGQAAVGKTKINMNNVHVKKWYISNHEQYELGEYNFGNSIPSMNTLTLI